MTKKNVLVTGLTFLMVGLMTVCASAVPQLLNYQGKLTNAVGDPLDGTYDVHFYLYTVDSGGSPEWDESQSVTVTDGFYSVQLGAVNPLPTGMFENDELYLEVVIYNPVTLSWETLSPRQRLTSTAFAMKAEKAEDADTLDGLDSTQFAGDTHDHSFSEITGSASDAQIPDDITIDYSTNADMLDGKDSSEFADAIHGHPFSEITGMASDTQIPMEIARDSELTWGNLSGIPAGFADGVDDDTDTTYSAGTGLDLAGTTFNVEVPLVLSGSSSTGGLGILSGTNSNEYGRGVYGKASNTAGNVTTRNYGGYFEAFGAYGYGVYGKATGIHGSGVYGQASNTGDYTNVGGDFIAKGTTGIGVRGSALYLGNDTNYGGKFSAGGWTGIGVYGYASRTTDTTNYGGYFKAMGSMGRGVYGESPGISGVGVYGFAPHTEAQTNYGGYFEARGKNGQGVYGIASNGSNTTNYGGYFLANGTTGRGVYGEATGTGGVGVWGKANDPFDGYAGFFEGRVYVDYRLGINTSNPVFTLDVNGTTRTNALVIGSGSDIAEPFKVGDSINIKPGMVVSIDSEQPGQVRIADRAYDRTVAGIVSGANGLNTGLTMSQEGTLADGTLPVALTGRVYAWADASNGPIKPGDLLTTSDTPGHAMKVTDYEKGHGAVLGKAMTGLKQGKGLVLVLVSLQ